MAADCPNCAALRRALGELEAEVAEWRRLSGDDCGAAGLAVYRLQVRLNGDGPGTVRRAPRERVRPGEVKALLALMARPGSLVTREALLRAVSLADPWDLDLKLVDVYVCKLRTALRRWGCGEAITTVRGQGFMIDPDAAALGEAAFA